MGRKPFPQANDASCIERYDSRVKRLLKEPDCVLINNYKCGFSSSNLLKTHEVRRITDNDRVILFYRNIFLRSVSTFINWCIKDDRHKREDGWLMANTKSSLPELEYSQYLDLLCKGDYEGSFRMYVKFLEKIYQMNSHTLPQVTLLEYYGIDKIDYFIDLERNSLFENITGVAFPYDRANKSNEKIKFRILNLLRSEKKLKGKIRSVYREDIDFFEGHGLSVDKL